MNPSIVVGAYWGPRPETTADLAQRFVDWFTRLAAVDAELFTGWRLPNRRSAASGKRFDFNLDLDRVIERGRPRRDSDGTVMEELGTILGVYSLAGIGVTCSVGHTTDLVPNAVVVTIESNLGDDSNIPRHVLRTTIESWEPDWGSVYTDELADLQAPAQRPHSPVVGYATYLSAARGSVSDLGAETEATPRGTLVVLREPNGPALGVRVVQLRAELDSAGLLEPTHGIRRE